MISTQPYPISDLDAEERKEILRGMIRQTRQDRSPRARQRLADQITEVVQHVPAIAQASCVALYASTPAEPSTDLVIDALAARGVDVLLPVLGDGLERDWALFRGVDDMAPRSPGRPPEPGGPRLGAEALAAADVVIAPAVAVDTAGTRLGQGGGWYDRALAHRRDGVPVFAMVFDEEIYDAGVRPLPREKHDHGVDGVITPTRWLDLRPGAE